MPERKGSMETRKYTVYKFDELSEEGKEKAIQSYREHDDLGHVTEHLSDLFHDALVELGFSDFVKVYWSVSYSQGDNAEISRSVWRYDRDLIDRFIENWRIPALVEVAESWQAYNENRETPVLISIDSRTWGFNAVMTDDDYELLVEGEDATDALEILNQLESALYTIAKDEYEYQHSDEVIAETLLANDYDFTEDGRID
jgi:hypothetical protein